MIGLIIKPIVYLIAGILTIASGVVLASGLFAFVSATPHVGYFSSNSYFLTWLGWIAGFVLFCCIMILVLFFLFRIFTKYNLKKNIRNGILGTGLISMILFVFSFLFHIPNYTSSSKIVEKQNIEIVDNEIVISEKIIEEMTDGIKIDLGETSVNRHGLFCDDVRVNIYFSEDENIRMDKIISSAGRSHSEAKKIARHVVTSEEINGNEILIPEAYRIYRGNKYRGQNVRYNIYIPETKKVIVDDNMRWSVWKNEFKERERKERKKQEGEQ